MHYTASEYGKYFFKTYANTKNNITIVDIGSLSVNGALRDHAPEGAHYIGLDFTAGKGVDLILQDGYHYPLEDNSVDIIVTSSCFEHSEYFWLTFMESMRILKADGLLYMSAPSNGVYHRYPTDNWRFYPDAGKAMSNYANTQGLNTELLESFIGVESVEWTKWRDFTSVLIKDKQYANQYQARMHEVVPQNLVPNNIWSYGKKDIINYQENMRMEDDFFAQRKSIIILSVKQGNIESIKNNWQEIVDQFQDPFHMSVENGDVDIARFFLDKGIDVNALALNGATPLSISIEERKIIMVELLLGRGADTEVPNVNKVTPLILSAYHGYLDITKLLLDSGADMRVTWNDKTPFQMAIEANHYDVAKVLMYDEEAQCHQIHGTDAQAYFVEICGETECWL